MYRTCPHCRDTVTHAERAIAEKARVCELRVDRAYEAAQFRTRVWAVFGLVAVMLAWVRVAYVETTLLRDPPARLCHLPSMALAVDVCHASDDESRVWICHPLPCVDAHEVRHLEIEYGTRAEEK